MTDPVLEALWKTVLDDWENDATHGAFLKYCGESDQLLEAAVRYRGMAGDRDRGPSAERKLTAISLLAIAKLESARTAPQSGVPIATKLAFAIFFVASLVALLFAWRHS
jgi:hypothetical protein